MYSFKMLGFGLARGRMTVTNEDISKLVDTSDEWITRRTGIKSGYISRQENTSDLGLSAAKMAIEDAGIDRAEIGLIIAATMTPDNFTPSTACLIQQKLGLSDCEVTAFDLNAACSGFIYALKTALALLPEHKKALVIGAETLSKLIDWTDRSTCILFGDGAGAVVLGREKGPCADFYTRSCGDGKQVLTAGGISMNALCNSPKDYSYLKMDGQEVFRFAVNAIADASMKVLHKNNLSMEDIDLIIPHQANIRIISAAARKLGMPESKFFTNLQNYGNTSAASVAIALAQCRQEGRLKKGMKILLVGFGAVLTYVAAYINL